MSSSVRTTPPDGPIARRATIATWVFGFVILAGILARVVQYAQRRPLFIDDVLLILNIVTRNYRELLQPLAIEQSAPPSFLWMQRLIVSVLGVSDVTFTLLSLAVGLAMLPIAWAFARRIVDRETSTLAVAMLAIAPPVIYYATSAKQYEMDVFVAVVLSWLGLRALEAPERASRWIAAIGGGVVALTLSMPALFVLGGVWFAWALSQPIRSTVRGRMLLVVSGAAWGATFVTLYLTMYAAVSGNDYMRRFWYGSYLSSQRSPWRVLRYVARGLQVALIDVGSALPWALVALSSILLIVGIAALVRARQFSFVALLTIPLLLAIAASSLGQWIMLSRFMLYSTPFVCILVAHGVVVSARRLASSSGYGTALTVAGGLAVLALPARYTLWVTRNPGNVEASPSMIQSFMAHARDGEPVYVYSRGLPLWTYYSTDWKHPDTTRVQRLLRSTIEIGPGSGNGQTRGHAVLHEGFERRYPFRGSVELIGVPTGMELTAKANGLAPDTGWAANEADRIREVASPSAWVAFAHYSQVPLRELQTALSQRGGQITFSEVRPGAALYKYQFAPRDSADSVVAASSAAGAPSRR